MATMEAGLEWAVQSKQITAREEGSHVWLLHAPNATSNAPHTKHLSDSWTWADERRIQSLF